MDNNLNNDDMAGLAARIREQQSPVTPKELRTMYVTFLKDAGVSEPVLEGTSKLMRHSLAMQGQAYEQPGADDSPP